MRVLVLLVLAVLACGHDAHSGTCEEVAAAAAAKCTTFDQPSCVEQCNAQAHPDGHLGSSRDAVESAADCNAALQILSDEGICS